MDFNTQITRNSISRGNYKFQWFKGIEQKSMKEKQLQRKIILLF